MNPSFPDPPYPSTVASESPASPSAGSVSPVVRSDLNRGGDTALDVELIRRVQSGDARALGAFYDRWFPIVNALVARMLKSPDDVEDVVEETFWQVWRQADRFTTERGSVHTWLLTIARSRALDRLRAIKRLREESLQPINVTSAADDRAAIDATPPVAHPSSDPSLDVELAERRELVLAALAELPREQREALELGYYGGLSQSEIAERTGQPLGTVKTRMRLALRKLRDRLSVLHDTGPAQRIDEGGRESAR